jgi:hypothetical protein
MRSLLQAADLLRKIRNKPQIANQGVPLLNSDLAIRFAPSYRRTVKP